VCIIVSFLLEIPCEDNPLGAEEGGKLPSSSFKASTRFYEFTPSNGRLNGPLAWCSAETTPGEEFLQIHVPDAQTICAIATQGTGYVHGNEYVTSYILEYSKDGNQWQILEEDGSAKVSLFFKEIFIHVDIVNPQTIFRCNSIPHYVRFHRQPF